MLELNDVLYFIAKSDFWIAPYPAKSIFKQFEKKHKMDYSDFLRALEKLFRDGYLEKSQGSQGETTYLLTFEGRGFAKKGGYSRNRRNIKNVTNPSAKEQNIIRYLLTGLIITIIGIILWLITR